MDIISYPIIPEKGKAWHFKSHPYFTKQAANVVATYITHHTKEGNTVLDPFGGTGVTALEALRLKRKAIIVDINPLACFLVKQTARKVNTDKLATTFSELESKVKEKIEYYTNLSDEDAKQIPLDYWYPQKIKLGKSSNATYVEDLFTRRQLLAYSFLLNEIKQIEDEEMREMMKYVFSSTMAKVNLTFMPSERDGKSVGGGGPAIFGTYDYWIPSRTVELPVWRNFAKKFGYILKGKKQWNDLLGDYDANANLQVIHGSALAISDYIPDNSIDYIYTDPPYGHNIAYLDLSTMWNAWLFPEVLENQLDSMLEQECIEGGSLHKTQKTYEKLFTESCAQMGKVLKKDSWLSMVFAHKKLEYWNVIVDACEDNAMELKGSTYQPQSNGSINLKKSPAGVLCSQRIANFQKTFIKPVRPKPDSLDQFILNEIEKCCSELNGASLMTIYNRVSDGLMDNLLGIEARKRTYTKSNKIDVLIRSLDSIVYDDETQLFYVKGKKDDDEIRSKYFANKNEMRIYLRELLINNKRMSLDQIHKEMFEIFATDKKFPIEKDLYILLEELAEKNKKTGKWSLKTNPPIQIHFTSPSHKLIKIQPEGFSHSEIIFRLVKIGEYLGFKSWIGKREQSADSFAGIKFSDISLPTLQLDGFNHFKSLDNKSLESKINKIQQIDVIWIDKLNFARYAFEVEQSTSIVSGFERFVSLLDIQHDIAKKLFIIAPKSREKKLNNVFKNSTYIGHPIYLENKVGLVFKENLVSFYDDHVDKNFTEDELNVLFNSVTI